MSKTPEQVRSEKIFKKICRKIGTTIRDHAMLLEDDHVLVGLSGGKDSMILLQALVERRAALPFDFLISAAHIEAEGIGYRIDREKLERFCADLEVPFYNRSMVPDLNKDPKKGTCFVCSWHRRKALFALTRELNCSKLALGHHRNDAVETLLLNMIYHGSISSLPYTLKMFDGRITLIRPLMDLDERIIEDYAGMNNLVEIEKSCPHEELTRRNRVAELMREIEKLHAPGTYNVFRSMNKIFEEYLPRELKDT